MIIKTTKNGSLNKRDIEKSNRIAFSRQCADWDLECFEIRRENARRKRMGLPEREIPPRPVLA